MRWSTLKTIAKRPDPNAAWFLVSSISPHDAQLFELDDPLHRGGLGRRHTLQVAASLERKAAKFLEVGVVDAVSLERDSERAHHVSLDSVGCPKDSPESRPNSRCRVGLVYQA